MAIMAFSTKFICCEIVELLKYMKSNRAGNDANRSATVCAGYRLTLVCGSDNSNRLSDNQHYNRIEKLF